MSHFNISIRGAAWGPVDPTDDSRTLTNHDNVDTDGTPHHRFQTESGQSAWSWMTAHVVAVPALRKPYGRIDGTAQDKNPRVGFVTYTGYTNRFGWVVDGCTKPDIDCVPLMMEGVPIGSNQYREDARMSSTGLQANYDTSPDGDYWLTWLEDKASGGYEPTPGPSPELTPEPASDDSPFLAADFTADVRIADGPHIVRFTNLSSAPATIFEWDVDGDDAADSTTFNPDPVTYANPGTYDVRLTAKTTDGEQDTMTRRAYIIVQ